MARLQIALLCGTHRGVAFAQRMFALCPQAEFSLCSFPEEPWEPRYLATLEGLATAAGHRFHVTRQASPADLFDQGQCDLLFAVSWRYLVRPEVYRASRKGAFVFHDSLLPKYRGFAPTPWAIINGERETGVTLMEMADPVDTGRIVDQVHVPIGATEYIETVLSGVTAAYLGMIERNLPALLAGTAPRRAQDEAKATYCCRRRPEDNRINWHAPAASVYNLIRACSAPYPGAYCFSEGRRLTIWTADPPERAHTYRGAIPGRIIGRGPDAGVRILAADHPLLVRRVQLEDGEIQPAEQILSGGRHTLT